MTDKCAGETADGSPCQLSADWGDSTHPEYCQYHDAQAPESGDGETYVTDFSDEGDTGL